MYVQPLIVFHTKLGDEIQREFLRGYELRNFIKSFDFSKNYDARGRAYTYNKSFALYPPIFYLGRCFSFAENGYRIKSDVTFLQKMWAGRGVEAMSVKNTDFIDYVIEIPFARKNHYEKYTVRQHKNDEFIVINPKTLQQVYPPVAKEDSKLELFLSNVLSERLIDFSR